MYFLLIPFRSVVGRPVLAVGLSPATWKLVLSSRFVVYSWPLYVARAVDRFTKVNLPCSKRGSNSLENPVVAIDSMKDV